MLYAILCYHHEEVVCSWTKEQDAAVVEKLISVQEKFARKRKLGPVVRLGPTSTATTLRKEREPFLVTDGPFAETKEQILGFYVVDCETQEEVIEFARELAGANPGGSLEIRPLTYFHPNDQLAAAVTMPMPNVPA